MKPFFVVQSNGNFFDLSKNPKSSIHINNKKLLIINDLNMNTELKFINPKVFISTNINFFTIFSYINQILVDITEQKINYSVLYNEMFITLSTFKITEDLFVSEIINNFFKEVLIQKDKILFLILNKNRLIYFAHLLYQIFQKKMTEHNKYANHVEYEESIYYNLLTENLKNYTQINNYSLFSQWERHLSEEDKLNYPKCYLKDSTLSTLQIDTEHIRYDLLNNYLTSQQQITVFPFDNQFLPYVNRSFEYWNLNCFLTFNLVFEFLKTFNPNKSNKKLSIDSKVLQNFLNKQTYLTIPAIYLIDIFVNYQFVKKFRADNKLNTKIENIIESGFLRHEDKKKERKYKNTVFDLVDIIMSLVLFHDTKNNIESIYITGDTGINLFFNWYELNNNSFISIKHKENSVPINILTFNQNKFLENTIKQSSKISDNKEFLEILSKYPNFFDKMRLIIKEYSIFYNDIYEDFLLKNSELLKIFYIKKSKYTFNDILNDNLSNINRYRWQEDENVLLVDLYLVELLNLYFNHLLKLKIIETDNYMENYFS